VFVAAHGGSGEDGRLQGLLELMDVCYTGSDVRSSAVAMDKDMSKHLLRAAGIPTADWLMAPVSEQQLRDTLGLPVVVKPSHEGSTVGLSVVRHLDELGAALELAAAYDREVMVERFIAGRELTCGVLAGQALGVGEIVPLRGELFDYASKYQEHGAEERFPAPVPERVTLEVRRLAALVHSTLKLGDYSRVDFRLDAQERLWVLEANSLPGLSARSLLPQSAASVGLSFPELCERICELARLRYAARRR
jgi:D-alanine-D-alanine ligase